MSRKKPPLKQLREEAARLRDVAIRDANEQYRQTLQLISDLQRRMMLRRDKPFQMAIYERLGVHPPTGECKDMTAADAAFLVLSEGKPMSLHDLVVEIQDRGCQTIKAHRSMVNTVRQSLHYHKDRYTRNERGLWMVIPK